MDSSSLSTVEPTLTGSAQQSVDPVVSRAKFEQEIAAFQAAASWQRSRGVFLLEANFPTVLVAFVTPNIHPRAIAFGVLFDFTNYDLEPPSVKFVDPLTGAGLNVDQLTTRLPRQAPQQVAPQLIQGPNGQLIPVQIQVQPQALVQAHEPDKIPFLCIAGVREYHEHPAHTGDSWLLHRGQGEGTLGFLIDQLVKYGTEPLNRYNPQVHFHFDALGNSQIRVARVGLHQDSCPL